MRNGVAIVWLLACACDQGVLPRAATAEPTPAKPAAEPEPAKPELVVRPPVAADLATYVKNVPGEGTKLVATIATSLGTFHCELFGDRAPMTVANFIGLATGEKPWLNPQSGEVERDTPFYTGLIFHRVIPGFMIQGGDPLGRGVGGPGYTFDDEIWQGAHVGAGVIAMANAGRRADGGTNGSQFFIMEGERADLARTHTVFGRCAELDLIKRIGQVPRNAADKPEQPVTIERVTITRRG